MSSYNLYNLTDKFERRSVGKIVVGLVNPIDKTKPTIKVLVASDCKRTVGLRRNNRDFDNFKSRVDFSLPILYYSSMSKFKRYYQDKNIVFITIVTYNRQQILVKNIELIRQSFKNIKYFNYYLLHPFY